MPKKSYDAEEVNVQLPFSARQLTKSDMGAFRQLFAHYLSLQKQLDLNEMTEREAKGRWKSFVGKWNRGELAEGWYDPEMFARISAAEEYPPASPSPPPPPLAESPPPPVPSQVLKAQGAYPNAATGEEDTGDSEGDEYGPVLPLSSSGLQAKASVPTPQDIAFRDELIGDDMKAAREESVTALRQARKADRRDQKERLDELVPRAEAGSRERMLEKRQEVNAKMRDFRDKSPGMEAENDKDLMGGGDSLNEYKQAKEREQRKKTEREIRREEMDRTKREQIEERRAAWRKREDGTMSMLKELAKQRFG